MLNTNYAPEIASAAKFIQDHSYDGNLRTFIKELQDSDYLIHSDKWSITYDWMKEHYPEVTGSLITGIVYFCER